MDNIKEKIVKSMAECVQRVALVVAEESVGRSVAPFGYEVEIPEELLQEENK